MGMERQKPKQWVRFRVSDVEKLKKSIKVGDDLSYTSDIKSTIQDRIVIPRENVIVVKKLTHLVIVDNPLFPSKELRTITYKDILFQRNGVGGIYEHEPIKK